MNHLKLLSSWINSNTQFLFEDHQQFYGRIEHITVEDDMLIIQFFGGQNEASLTQTLAISGMGDLSSLKRGDVVALQRTDSESNDIERIVLLNPCATFPAATQWSNEDAYHHRELDVLIRPQVMQDFLKRNQIVFAVRQYMQKKSFCEVELPILKVYPDIAPSPHFDVSNAAGFANLFVRTTFPPFERLLVGLSSAYTIGPNFRNGDFSYKNLPEFQMFCMCAAGKHYLWAARFLQSMFAEIATNLNGNSVVTVGGKAYDLSDWEEVELKTAFKEILNCNIEDLDTDENLLRLCEDLKIDVSSLRPDLQGHTLRAVLFDAVFEQRIVNHFVKPTFFYEVPWYLAGPAEPVSGGQFLKLRGEGYVGGMELMNAKCVLTSFEKTNEWHQKFTAEKKRLGFGKHAETDSEFLKTIEFGLVPGSLASFGLDRLVMMLLRKDSICDVTMYPLTNT
jgi:lysyl-tRNA synthetase, class II